MERDSLNNRVMTFIVMAFIIAGYAAILGAAVYGAAQIFKQLN